jgi:flagella basal body P-ring formation protein FlgA
MRSWLVYFSIGLLVMLGIVFGSIAVRAAEVAPTDKFMVSDMEAVLQEALIARGVDKDMTLDQITLLPEGSRSSVPLAKAKELGINYPLKLKDLVLQENLSRFTAVLERAEDTDKPLPDDALVRPSLPVASIEVKGRYVEMVEVPALSKRMAKGDIIAASDIEYISVAKNRVRPSTITEEEQLIGKAAHRAIDAGDIIRISDVTAPKLVERGKMIAIFYRTGAMELKDMGYAMADGAKGDIISVKNARSNTVLQAMVNAPNTAIVNYWQQASK